MIEQPIPLLELSDQNSNQNNSNGNIEESLSDAEETQDDIVDESSSNENNLVEFINQTDEYEQTGEQSVDINNV